jgi:hypothetical protein
VAAELSAAVRELRTISRVSTILTVVGNIAFILLLITFFRRPARDESATDVPVSELLSWMATVAIMVGGGWLAFGLVRLVFTPYNYSQLRSFDLLQLGRVPP